MKSSLESRSARLHVGRQSLGRLPRLPLPREAVAYIGAAAKRPASRRLIRLGAFPEALRTPHLASPLRRQGARWTYATASRGRSSARVERTVAGTVVLDGVLRGVKIERNRETLSDTQSALLSGISAQEHPFARVVVPAAAGSSPVAHPFRPANADVCTSGASPGVRRGVQILPRQGPCAFCRNSANSARAPFLA